MSVPTTTASAPTEFAATASAASSESAATNPQAAPATNAVDALFPPGPDGKPAKEHVRNGPGGRFVVGNPGGPGNPYARQTAAFRRKFQSCVKEEDIEKAYEALAKAAHEGNVPALRLFFEYVTGKPAKAEDPDRMDAHEWELSKETVVTGQELAQVNNAPTMDANLRMTRMFRPLLTSTGMSKLATMLRDGPPPEPEVEDISLLDQPAPFPNGPIGAALKANIQGPHVPKPPRSPSPNRPIGAATQSPPIGNGPIGPDQASQVSIFGTSPSPNGKKRHKHAKGR